jgi:hypothetical protein
MKDNQIIREFPKDAAKKEKKPSRSLGLWIGSVIILIFAAVSFIFIPGMVRAGRGANGGVEPFGYYNKKPIELAPDSFFSGMVEQYQEQMRLQGQNDANSTYYIFQSAFNASVLNEAFTYAVDKSGYVVPQNAIDRQMIPYFYENGVYSPKRFNDTSQSRKLELRKQVTNTLIYQRYYEDMFGALSDTLAGSQLYGKKTSSKETDFLASMGAKERAFELAAFDTSRYPESEAIAFAQSHSDLFAKYNISVITVNTENEAKKVLRQITNNEIIFEDAVTDLSVKYYSGDDGKFSSAYQYQIKNVVTKDEDFSAVMSLVEGAVSGVIQTTNGYSIFRSDGPIETPDFNEPGTSGIVLNYMRSYERGIIEDYYTNIANDFASAASRDGFDTACIEYNVLKIDVPSFPINYGSAEIFPIVPSSTVSQLSGAETNETFLRTAFSLQEGEISSPMALGNNVVVLKMNSETIKDEDENAAVFLVPYYSEQFDQGAVQNAVLTDERLTNNFLQVFFKYYLGS